jgi:hypothetical protein
LSIGVLFLRIFYRIFDEREYNCNFARLFVFPVTHYRPRIKKQGKRTQRKQLRSQLENTAPFEENHPHHLNDIFQGINYRQLLRPLRHTRNGSEQSTHQYHDYHKEKYYEHRLLHRFRMVGDD